MMKIAICDDEKKICNEVETIVEKIMEMNNVEHTCSIYYSGNKLFSAINLGESFDIIFLDIEMNDLNGIEVGQKIREELRDEYTKIIYISWKNAYSMDLFGIRPFDFLIKPIDVEKVDKPLSKAIEIIKSQSTYFYYKDDNQFNKIQQKEILYFESDNRHVIMYTRKGNKRFYGKLEEVIQLVDERYFWRIHKSYLINYENVRKFEYEQVIMDNGEELTISQINRKRVRSLQKNLLEKRT